MVGEQLIEVMRQGEDNMIVWNGQQLAFPIYDPSFFVDHLAFRTVSIPARIVGDRLHPTGFADSHMTSKGFGSTKR